MAYDAAQLMAMSQTELDDLFRASPAGRFPNGEAKGTAIIAPGTKYSARDRRGHQPFRLAGQSLRRREGAAEEPDPRLRVEAIVAQGLQGAELARQQGVHRPRLLRDLARRPVRPRRDPSDRPGLLPWQGVLGQGSPDRLLPPVLSMTPQDHFMVVAPIAAGREADLRAVLSSMNAAPGIADPRNPIVPFGAFERLHFARLVVLDDATAGRPAGARRAAAAPADLSRFHRRLRRTGATTRSPISPSVPAPGWRGSSATAKGFAARRRPARLDACARPARGGELRELARPERSPDSRGERVAARARGAGADAGRFAAAGEAQRVHAELVGSRRRRNRRGPPRADAGGADAARLADEKARQPRRGAAGRAARPALPDRAGTVSRVAAAPARDPRSRDLPAAARRRPRSAAGARGSRREQPVHRSRRRQAGAFTGGGF